MGTWLTRVRPRDCVVGTVPPIDGLRGLFSFHEGGTTSECGIGPGSTPALRSPGHGVWQREPGWNAYSNAFVYYRDDAAGNYVGAQRVRSEIELASDGDTFIGNSTVQTLDANDDVVATFCAQAAGTRFE